MREGTAATLLFVVYCVEVGVFLLFAPWSSSWDQSMIAVPVPQLHTVYLHPVFRGALSGFGLIHIVWGAHDLDQWLVRRGLARQAESEGRETS
ncbi:MAG: hypothetical protein OEM62_12460 [Acidobacteriota bacterium]|nr:hypothetical protein [Acidobacteriota bacterium]